MFEFVFAAGVLIAAAALVAAALRIGGRRVPLAALAATGAGAVAAWVAFALSPSWSLAISAAGLLACVAASAGAWALERAQRRSAAVDDRVAEAERRLDDHVERLVAAPAEELERTIARTRSESVSLLADHERRSAEERRNAATELAATPAP